jgi:hypothetical protein
MNYADLNTFVKRGLSIREIAAETSRSFTSVKYWLGKHGLATKKRVEFKCACGERDPAKFYGHKRHICGKCQNAYVVQRGREMRKRIVEFLGGRCRICGYHRCIEAFDVHHPDPKKKDPNFRHVRGWSWDRVEREIRRCILLCKNCHAEVHAGVLTIGV